MEGNRLNYEKDNKVSEFILPPMSEWDNPGESSENKAVASISRIKQKYRDSVLLEIYESDRILHPVSYFTFKYRCNLNRIIPLFICVLCQ